MKILVSGFGRKVRIEDEKKPDICCKVFENGAEIMSADYFICMGFSEKFEEDSAGNLKVDVDLRGACNIVHLFLAYKTLRDEVESKIENPGLVTPREHRLLVGLMLADLEERLKKG